MRIDAKRTSRSRLILLATIALLPSFIKRPLYRTLFGYQIGRRVRIGLSIIDARECRIDDDVYIGNFNIFLGIEKLSIGDHAVIRYMNIIHGGSEVRLGRYVEILRMNEINSIPEPIVVNEVDQRFILGDGSMIGASHKIDFTDRVEFGKRVMLGGRNSSLWTHNRQSTLPITIGDNCYLGSEIRMVAGSAIPPRCIVGIGSVVTKVFENEEQLIAGVPAAEVKHLGDDGRFLVEHKTRPDLPDDI